MAGARGPARRELVGRLLRSRNRRRAPGDGPRIRLRQWLPALVVLLAVAAIIPPVVARARRHSYFAVRDVVVRSANRLTAAEVQRVAGVELGESIWEVDPAAVEARLAAHPWVHAAQVERDPPARVVIRVREERPAAILTLRDPTVLYYVGRGGRVLAPVGRKDSHDFPFITGLTAGDLSPGADFGPYALRRALALLRAAGRTPGLQQVSEIEVDGTRGLRLLLLRPAVPIEVGWRDFASRLAPVPRVLALWRGHESDLTAVSIRVPDQVIVRTRTLPKGRVTPDREVKRS